MSLFTHSKPFCLFRNCTSSNRRQLFQSSSSSPFQTFHKKNTRGFAFLFSSSASSRRSFSSPSPSSSFSPWRTEVEYETDPEEVVSGYGGMSVLFLGTSSNMPTKERNVSSLAVMLEKENWMVDCGEGTMIQILRSHGALKLTKLTRFFITHLHGDHVWGLPAVLAEASANARQPLHVYGPAGIRQMVRTTMDASQFKPPVQIIFHEIFEKPSPRRGADDFVIGPDSPAEILFEDEKMEVRAGFIKHGIACWGFVFQEKNSPGRIIESKFEQLGIPRGLLWKLIKVGNLPVITPDGRKVPADEIVTNERVGRKVVILGDTHDPSGLLESARDADVLVHECTLPDVFASRAQQWGHSTPTMAGEFARRANARSLVLTHFSPRFHRAPTPQPSDHPNSKPSSKKTSNSSTSEAAAQTWPSAEQLAKRAAEVFGGPVIAANDFMQIDLPLRHSGSGSKSSLLEKLPPPVFVDFARAQGEQKLNNNNGGGGEIDSDGGDERPKPLRITRRKTWF